MRPWTAAQDEVLRELVSKQGRRPKWKEITEALRNDGNYRTVAMVRNRYLRIEKGKELTELGLSKNRCSLCGQIKRGHVCPGVVEGWREKAPQEHSDAAAGSSSSPSAGSYEHELVSMYVARLLEATDLTTMTLKGIRARLADDLQAEAGKHYDKTWLQDEVKRLLSLRQEARRLPMRPETSETKRVRRRSRPRPRRRPQPSKWSTPSRRRLHSNGPKPYESG